MILSFRGGMEAGTQGTGADEHCDTLATVEDVSGAAHFGFATCWVNRQGAPMDELGITATRQVRDLSGLSQRSSG